MSNKINALFTGLSILDIQYFTNKNLQNNTKLRAEENKISVGGPATNAAIAASFLGLNTTLVSPVGRHSLTDFVSGEFIKCAINHIDPAKSVDVNPLFSSIISNTTNGDRTVIYYLSDNLEKAIASNIRLPENQAYKIALFDGYFIDLSIEIARQLKESGTTTMLDGGSWKPGLEKLLPYIDIVICSSDFLPPDTYNPVEVIEFLKSFGVSEIAITRGEKSILVGKRDGLLEIPVAEVKAVDTCGAGDIFHGAFCAFYPAERNFEKALKKASQVASFSCEYRGTQEWMKEFEKCLND
jgi:sugar/nucleoside kinase (ribokinase family)